MSPNRASRWSKRAFIARAAIASTVRTKIATPTPVLITVQRTAVSVIAWPPYHSQVSPVDPDAEHRILGWTWPCGTTSPTGPRGAGLRLGVGAPSGDAGFVGGRNR